MVALPGGAGRWRVRGVLRLLLFALGELGPAGVDLLAVHRHTLRRLDAQAHLAALKDDNGDPDLPVDHDALSLPASQYEHDIRLHR
jgi:hypothetical protein